VDKSVFSQGTGTRTTPALTTAAAGERLVAFVMSDGPASINSQTVTVSGAGLAWTRVQRAATRYGDAEIWTASASGVLTNATVTSTPSAGGFYQALYVVAFRDVSGIGASNIAAGTSGAATIGLTPQATGSVVYAVGNDWDRGQSRTLPAGQTKVFEYLAPVGDTFWVQTATAQTAAAVPVTLNTTGPTNDQWNFAVVELKR
jgi:hypothetical protein